jgi:hypothetical protein
MIVTAKAARQVPGGPFSGSAGSYYQYPREKKPSSASTRITMRMIQRMLMRFRASYGLVAGLNGLISAETQRKPLPSGYGVAAGDTSVTIVRPSPH